MAEYEKIEAEYTNLKKWVESQIEDLSLIKEKLDG